MRKTGFLFHKFGIFPAIFGLFCPKEALYPKSDFIAMPGSQEDNHLKIIQPTFFGSGLQI
jgi:hypothetical protein